MARVRLAASVQELFTRHMTRWTKGAYARGTLGGSVENCRSAEAVCWCLDGALQHVYGTYTKRYAEMRHRLVHALPLDSGSLTRWNDHPDRTFKDIMRVVRKAGV